ncbi:MAG: hypothetical protein ACYCY2_10195 [Acidithiobacillus ferriphilus]
MNTNRFLVILILSVLIPILAVALWLLGHKTFALWFIGLANVLTLLFRAFISRSANSGGNQDG